MRDVIDELDATLNDTLTFDFESLSPGSKTEAAGTTRSMRRDASVLAAAEAAAQGKAPDRWSPSRRSSSNRLNDPSRRRPSIRPFTPIHERGLVLLRNKRLS